MVREELREDEEWWNKKSAAQQQDYIRQHPQSQKAIDAKKEKEDDKSKGKVSEKPGGASHIKSTGGNNVLLAKGTREHIARHNKPGEGSVFSDKISIDDVQGAIGEIPEEFYEKGGGVHTTTVPNAGFNLVQKASDIEKNHPNAKKIKVKKQIGYDREKNKPIMKEVDAYIIDADKEEFSTDQLNVIVRPSNSDFMDDELKSDSDVQQDLKDGKSHSVLTSFPGDPDVPPAQNWEESGHAIIIPNGGKDADKSNWVTESVEETKKRDYKAEYKKFQSSTKAKKYRAELNKYNRKKGTYGNGDGKDASHKGGKIVGFEAQSKNRGRAEKSRLKKESFKENKDKVKKYLISKGDTEKDATEKLKYYDYIKKTYKGITPARMATIMGHLAKMESVNERTKMRPQVKKLLKQKGYNPIFGAIDNSKRQLKQMRYSRGEIQDTLISMFGDEDPKILQKIKESINEKKGDFLDSLFPKSKVDKAVKIAQSMGGDMTGAVKKIEKYFKGISLHSKVKDALQQANESINEEMYFDPKSEFKKYMDKVFKQSKIKVIKFNRMKQSFHNGAWGGFYTVKSSNKVDIGGKPVKRGSAVLPVYISRVGEIELGVKAGGFHIGKVGSSQVVKNLKDFKKGDLDESVNEDVYAIVDKFNQKKQDYDQVYFKDNNLNKVKKHMKKMGKKYGKMNLIKVKTNGKMSLVESVSKSQAQEIMRQLGGRKFEMLMGVKSKGVGKDGLILHIGKNPKRISHIIIDIDRGKDLYNLTFGKVYKYQWKVTKKLKGIYVDQLHDMIEKYTGNLTTFRSR